MNIKTIAVAGALSLVSFGAAAATATSTLEVSATVTDSCIVSTTPVAFGDYNPVAATAVTAEGSVVVTCSNGTSYQVGLDAGSGTGATVASRVMDDAGAGVLTYGLYTDANWTTAWGNTVDIDTYSDPVLTLGSGESQSHTIYGQINAGQNTVPKGNYTDTVNVTVSYAL